MGDTIIITTEYLSKEQIGEVLEIRKSLSYNFSESSRTFFRG